MGCQSPPDPVCAQSEGHADASQRLLRYGIRNDTWHGQVDTTRPRRENSVECVKKKKNSFIIKRAAWNRH